MFNFTLLCLLFFFSCFCQSAPSKGASFRIPYYQQFFDLNPQSLKTSSGQFFYQNLFRNLLYYDNEKGLIPDLAKKCQWKTATHLRCTLKENLKWSDGTEITPDHFYNSYKSLLTGSNNYPRKDFFDNIQGAKDFSSEKVPWAKVGIKIKSTNKSKFIEFFLIEPDSDFEFTLSQTITAPIKEGKKIEDFKALITSGPFKIKDYRKTDQRILFEKNSFYQGQKTDIPIEWIYLTEDNLQIPLYLKNELDMVRKLPTSQIQEWKGKKDFFSQEVLRFDYFGFNLEKISKPQREIFFNSLPLLELKKIFNSPGKPGCFQLSEKLTGKEELCYPDNKTITEEDKLAVKNIKAEFLLSQSGGEDHQRASEWMQNQWQEKLNIKVAIRIIENKIFLQHLKTNLPTFFRKGVPLESSSCFAALKIFLPGSPENLSKINNQTLNQIISKLKIEKNIIKKQKLCTDGLNLIMKELYIFPTGRFDLSYLIRPQFSGFKFNHLNYLDLGSLEYHE